LGVKSNLRFVRKGTDQKDGVANQFQKGKKEEEKASGVKEWRAKKTKSRLPGEGGGRSHVGLTKKRRLEGGG